MKKLLLVFFSFGFILSVYLFGCTNECKHSEVVIDDAILPTCTTHGITEGLHCKFCGKIIVKQEIIESLGHEIVLDLSIETSCMQEGKSYGVHCSRCGDIIIEQTSIDKNSHVKGEYLGLIYEHVDGVSNPGLFECSVCHNEFYDSVTQNDLNIPIMSIQGDISKISKNNKVAVTAEYSDDEHVFELNAMLKLQGGTSINYPKKNFNIQFFKDETLKSKQKVLLVDSWGKQSKYTLKANYIDFSAMRNVISGKIYGDIVKSRNISDEFNSLINGGAIDGYPILVFLNGDFQGLYTLNTAKDGYLFGMDGDDTTREAMLMVNGWSDSARLQEHIPEDFGTFWELEYASTEDNDAIGVGWVSESFNKMIDFINENNGEDFIKGISEYINVPRAIDSMLFTWAMHASDNSAKNILWVTYNGVQWTPSVYDMDGTWGIRWNGANTVSTSAWIAKSENVLWDRLYSNMYDDVVARWRELREGPLSITNIDKKVVDFYNLVPGELYDCERQKWNEVPSQYTNHGTQIVNWANEALKNMDIALGVDIDEDIAYKITFIKDENVVSCVYMSNDYSKFAQQTDIAYSRNSDTGYLTNSDGQINFKIVLAYGYEIENIDIVGTYKNLKGPNETGEINTYRITKISDDLTVTIVTKQSNT